MIAGIVASQLDVGPTLDLAPVITSGNSVSVAENVTLSHALTANESVTWSLVGGADQARFEISGSTLRWLSNGTKNFEAPDDADTNNTYIVTVRATDTGLNTTDQTITATVTDVDEVAPTLSSATGTETGSTTADLSVSTNEGNGTLYWVVTQSSTSPSKAQVKAGQNHAGAAADDSGSQAVSGTGVQNAGATGLTAETEYWAHFMHEDTATNQSDVATSASFTTEAGDASLLGILTSLGLTTGLKLCLDAGDSASYSSGQSWLDRSGGGFDFFLGGTGSVEATDPTFNGTPGGLSSSEFWSFDGGDNFTYDTTNETWMQNLHKDSAIYTILAWIYPITTSEVVIVGTLGANANFIGIEWVLNLNGGTRIEVGDGSAPLVLSASSALTSSDSTWNFYGLSLNEATGAGGCIHVINDASDTDTSTYSATTGSPASFAMQIGASGNNNARFVSGTRLAMVAIWEGVALTAAELDSIYEATRGRFGV